MVFIADLGRHASVAHAIFYQVKLLLQCFQTARLSIGVVGFAGPVHALFPC